MLLRRPKSLTELASRKLKDAILSGRLKPGQRLLETELSNRLGISRAPFREAIRELAAEGLVEIRHNRGAHVASPEIEQLHHMVPIRATTEGMAARLITFHRSRATFARLSTILDRLDAAHRDGDTALVKATHWIFHRAICVEAGNPYLLQSWESISNLIRLYHSLTLDTETVARNNRVFLRSFEHETPELAEALLRSQIIRMAYHYLGVDIPLAMAGYVTHCITADRRITPWRPVLTDCVSA